MALTRVKQRLVGTAVGRSLMRLRELRALRKILTSNPEQGGMLCQDLCARILLPRLCKPLHVFVDVGAHIGSVTAEVLHRDPSARIVAVEADPEKAARLKRRFPDVDVHDCAVGDRKGEVTFYIDERRPGYSSLARRNRRPADVRQIDVPMRRLDDILSSTADVGLIKIDVEGAELAVLRGAAGLLSRCRPVVLFESGPQGGRSMGFGIEEIFDWLAGQGYEILVPNRVAHDGPALCRESFVESHVYPRRTLNYFAVPTERRIEVRDRAREVLGIVAPSQGA